MKLTGFVNSPVCMQFALALMHFLWVGSLMAVLAVIAAGVFGRKSPRIRYWTYLICLFGMILSFAVTGVLIEAPITPTTDISSFERKEPTPYVRSENTALSTDVMSDKEGSESSTGGDISTASNASRPTSSRESFPGLNWERCVPYVIAVYCVGVLVMLGRLAIGLQGGCRLQKLSEPVKDTTIVDSIQQQAEALGLAFIPAIAICKSIAIPTVVGVLKPTILLPISFASGLTLQQVEMLLLHELAHIRRYDPLINVMQRIIEALLFFHPAVWLISRRIRIERENCCDDVVLETGAKATEYASSLIQVAQQSLLFTSRQRVRSVGISVAGHPSRLRNRIHRLVGQPLDRQIRLRHAWAIMAGLTVILGLAAIAKVGTDTLYSKAPVVHSVEVPSLEVKGRVISPDGLPLAGVKIKVNLDRSDSKSDILISGAEGEFQYKGYCYLLKASHPDWPEHGALVSPQPDEGRVLLILKKIRTFEGKVLNPKSMPVNGAEIIVQQCMGSHTASGVGTVRRMKSEQDGSFVIDDLIEGVRYRVIVYAETYARSVTGSFYAEGGEIFTGDIFVMGRIIRMHSGREVTFTVLSPDGKPVPDAVVTVGGKDWPYGRERTNDAGEVRVGGIPKQEQLSRSISRQRQIHVQVYSDRIARGQLKQTKYWYEPDDEGKIIVQLDHGKDKQLKVDSKVQARVQEVLLAWLKLFDERKYDDCWEQAHWLYRDDRCLGYWYGRGRWGKFLLHHQSLGEVISRDIRSMDFSSKGAGSVEEEKFDAIFDTTFSNATDATETISAIKDKNGIWRVSGHTMNTKQISLRWPNWSDPMDQLVNPNTFAFTPHMDVYESR